MRKSDLRNKAMDNHIENPIFVILDDSTVLFLHEWWEVDCCGIEPIDVSKEEYTAYDSEGQVLSLVTINKAGKIERPAEDIINIPFLGKIIGVTNDKNIKAIPTGVKEPARLIEYLVRDLYGKRDIEGLTLPELVQIYKNENPEKVFDD